MATTTPSKLLLEAPPAPSPTNSNEPATIKLNVTTGAAVSLYDQLGPTIVSSEGVRIFLDIPRNGGTDRTVARQTLTRIGNWGEMDEMERDRVLRVLGARNKIRLEAKMKSDEDAELANSSKGE